MVKTLITLLFPVSLCIIILAFGLSLLWFTKKQRFGKLAITIGFILLVLFSTYPFSYAILGYLERQYKTFRINDDFLKNVSGIKYVVILGGGLTSDPRLPITSQLNHSSLIRLIEGIRLYRKIPGAKLILSGGVGFDCVSDAEMMERLSISLGVEPQDIILESKSLNTYEEAKFIKNIVGDKRFILVTSAAHMPRAMALFKKSGMEPISAPTDHLVRKHQRFHPIMVFPKADRLKETETAFYEYIGLIKERLAGRI